MDYQKNQLATEQPDEATPTDSSPELVAISDEQLAQLKQAQMVAYLAKHSDRCNEWVAHHKPHQKFPVTYDHNSQLVWLNRKARRKLK